MRLRPFGRAMVPVIGEGTWQMEADDRATCVRAIRRAIELGASHVDTAEMYGAGEVERIVGEAIRGIDRDALFLVSKVLPSNASYEGTRRACEASLRRLGVDALDCYLLHWPGRHPLEETFRAFDSLEAEGKIRSWGVSNFDADDVERAVRIAGEGRIACNQVLYHLEERAIEHRVIPACEAHGIAIVAYSPLGSGSFPAPRSKGGAVLARIAKAHGVSPRTVALRFLIDRPTVLAVPKASRPEHVEDNARAADLALTRDELDEIDHAFPRGRARGLPTL